MSKLIMMYYNDKGDWPDPENHMKYEVIKYGYAYTIPEGTTRFEVVLK